MSEKQTKPFLAKLRELNVGETIEQPLNKRAYVSSACTRFGLDWDKAFSTRTEKTKRVVIITRTA